MSVVADATGRPTTRPALLPGPALLWRSLAAGGAGVMLTFAFPRHDLWWLAVPAVAGLSLAVRGLRPAPAMLPGLAFGLGQMLVLLHWAGVYVGPVPWLILAVFQAVYFAPMAAAIAFVQRLAWPVTVLGTAGAWVAQEGLRIRWPFGGFGWGRLGFSQADAPALGFASVGGAVLVTALVAAAGASLAVAITALRPFVAVKAGLAAVLCLGLVLSGSLVPRPEATGGTVTVALIQGNVPRLGLDFNAQREAVLGNHVRATVELAAAVERGEEPQPDLVIWPENASDIDPYANADAAAAIQVAVDAIGVPTLVGTVITNPDDPDTVLNVGIVWGPTGSTAPGPGDRYAKQHPVPFAEYIPFRRIARVFSSAVDRVSRDFAAGTEVGVLQVGPATLGDVICFEISDDGIVRRTVGAGAEILVVQTNNATFGRTAETNQQLAMSQLRAVEQGRYVLVAATSGVSAVIAPDGSIVEQSGIFTQRTIVQQVRLAEGRTLASTYAPAVEITLVLVGLVLALLGSRRREQEV